MEELKEFVDMVTAAGSISAQDARRFRGRFVFSRSQVFGRVGAPALRLLGDFAEGRSNRAHSADILKVILGMLLEVLIVSPPRKINASMPMPALVFVDGACEPGRELPCVGVGACLFDHVGDDEVVEYFGDEAGPALVREWANRPDQQVIAQAELVPVAMALSTWGPRLKDRPVVIFIDNDAARFGLVSGYSPVLASAALISVVWRLLAQLGTAAWFARVPTCCNPADGPSRASFEALRARVGSKRVSPSFLGAQGIPMWSAIAERLRTEIPT